MKTISLNNKDILFKKKEYMRNVSKILLMFDLMSVIH